MLQSRQSRAEQSRAIWCCRADRAEQPYVMLQSRALWYYSQAEQSFIILQSRHGRAALYDVAEHVAQSNPLWCCKAGRAEQPYVMLQSRQSRTALYIIIKMLCYNNYVCLLRSDSYDKLVSYVCDNTLTYAYTCKIANESLDFDMKSGY